jgi:hypothetical protein
MLNRQVYMIESPEIADIANQYGVALTNHYSKIQEFCDEIGAETIRMSNQRTIAGVSFAKDPGKEWKIKKGDEAWTPTKQGLKFRDQMKELNETAPTPQPLFEHIGWQTVYLDSELLEPMIEFVNGFPLLSHPVFVAKEQTSLDIYPSTGLRAITENDRLRMSLLKRNPVVSEELAE